MTDDDDHPTERAEYEAQRWFVRVMRRPRLVRPSRVKSGDFLDKMDEVHPIPETPEDHYEDNEGYFGAAAILWKNDLMSQDRFSLGLSFFDDVLLSRRPRKRRFPYSYMLHLVKQYCD